MHLQHKHTSSNCAQNPPSDSDTFTTQKIRIGGFKLGYALAHALGLPSHSNWCNKNKDNVITIIPCPNVTYLVSVVNHNLEEHCGNSSPEHKDLHELTMDETKIDATPSHDKATKKDKRREKEPGK